MNELATEGLGRALRNADPDWLADVYDAIVDTAAGQPVLHADDVWESLGDKAWAPPGTNTRASGGPWKRATRNGMIVPVDDLARVTRHASRHGQLCRIYISAISEAEAPRCDACRRVLV